MKGPSRAEGPLTVGKGVDRAEGIWNGGLLEMKSRPLAWRGAWRDFRQSPYYGSQMKRGRVGPLSGHSRAYTYSLGASRPPSLGQKERGPEGPLSLHGKEGNCKGQAPYNPRSSTDTGPASRSACALALATASRFLASSTRLWASCIARSIASSKVGH